MPPGFHQRPRYVRVRLFNEFFDLPGARVSSEGVTKLNIAVAGFRTLGFYSQCYKPPIIGYVTCGCQSIQKNLFRCDFMIARHYRQNCIISDCMCCQCDCWRCISPTWLSNYGIVAAIVHDFCDPIAMFFGYKKDRSVEECAIANSIDGFFEHSDRGRKWLKLLRPG